MNQTTETPVVTEEECETLGPAPGANFAEIKAAANRKMISDAVDQLYKLEEADKELVRETMKSGVLSSKHLAPHKPTKLPMVSVPPRPVGLLGNLLKNIR